MLVCWASALPSDEIYETLSREARCGLVALRDSLSNVAFSCDRVVIEGRLGAWAAQYWSRKPWRSHWLLATVTGDAYRSQEGVYVGPLGLLGPRGDSTPRFE